MSALASDAAIRTASRLTELPASECPLNHGSGKILIHTTKYVRKTDHLLREPIQIVFDQGSSADIIEHKPPML
jgi:hypothetical protein